MEVSYGNEVGAHFGYGRVREINSFTNGTYLTIGTRNTDYDIGWRSATIGVGCAAVYVNAFAVGNGCIASNANSVAMGGGAQATGDTSFATGWLTHAGHAYSYAGGYSSKTGASYQFVSGRNLTGGNQQGQAVFGRYNSTASSSMFVVGCGTASASKNILNLATTGNLTIAGTLTQSSDRRLKKHIAYLGDEAADFVRNLKPVLYEKDDTRQVGFYAQDVEEVEPWHAAIVNKTDGMDERLKDLRTLDYTALIAPLVAYTQQLEAKVNALTARLEEVLSSA